MEPTQLYSVTLKAPHSVLRLLAILYLSTLFFATDHVHVFIITSLYVHLALLYVHFYIEYTFQVMLILLLCFVFLECHVLYKVHPLHMYSMQWWLTLCLKMMYYTIVHITHWKVLSLLWIWKFISFRWKKIEQLLIVWTWMFLAVLCLFVICIV